MTTPKTRIVLLALFAAWCLLIVGRDVWTPDEPRELALSASQVATFTALPTLGGMVFAEKPPLGYWLAATSMREFGTSAAAARAPQLLYALIALCAVFLLARRMDSPDTGTIAALVFATSWLVLNVQTWLATDALLLACVALALLGMHIGVTARGDLRQLWRGFGLMHLGLLLALFTKNFAGWLIPVSTLITYMILERRLRELWHPAVWLPAIGTMALLIFWGRDVAAAPQGNDSIHQLFWNNLAGRMAAYIRPSNAVVDLGHRNWPGKYLIELPLYLLPWTPLAIGAGIRLWRERRIRSAADSGRRFALCATVPALVILSVAATARGTYAAPLLVGVALLIALALTAHPEDPELAAESKRLMARAFRWTAWLILLIDGTLLLGIDVVMVRRNEVAGVAQWVALSGVAAVIALGGGCLRDTAERDPAVSQSLSALRRLTLTHLGGLIAIAITALPLLNRWQDLVEVADHIEKIAAGRPLILWLPDETTLAMSDLYMRPPSCVVRSDEDNRAHSQDQLDSCLRRYPDAVVVGMQFCTDCKITRSLLSATDPLQPRHLPLTDPALLAAGLHPALGVIRPGGRTYLVSIRGK